MNTKVDEGKLISGKEALIALANGESVEMADSEVGMDWTVISKHGFLDEQKISAPCLPMFFEESERIRFRLKPRTITINGIEAPSIKKESAIYRSNDTVAIVCESFEEAELMCLALRQVFGGSHDN